jgi:tRNA(Ile)-lysidine synthase
LLKEKVINTIKKYNLIDTADKIVIGVSGGPDSMCLLHILNEIKNEFGFEIVVAHINHMIREEADEETKYVEEYCKKINVDCYVKKVNVVEKSNEEKIGTEEAGRKVRYDFFEEILNKVGANKIATAHNANDNAETVLMNIIRGTGTSGLKGIEPIRDNKFIRPIIECERAEIEEYCELQKLNPKIDKSNFENVYTRNKIRNIIIPEIKKEINPNVVNSLNKLSNLAKQENEFLQKYVDDIMEKKLIIDKKINNSLETNQLVLNLKQFNKLDTVIKNRVIIKSIEIVKGSTQGIEKIHIDDIVKLCEKNVGNKYLQPNKNLKVFVGKGKILIETVKF